VTELEFLVADPAAPAWRSPLAHAALPEGIRDVCGEVARADVGDLGPAAGIAGIELAGPRAAQVLRRLTDVAFDTLPALAPVAAVRARVERPDLGRFRIWFPQEYGDHVTAAVVDAWEGLA
jgi:hypothetical protein